MTTVFQYGSNTLESEINSKKRLNGAARFVGIAETVEPYELVFDVFSNNRGCAMANIVTSHEGKKVWGILYDVPDNLISRQTTPKGSKSFDAIEGEGVNHRRHCLRVRKPNGEELIALTYVTLKPTKRLKRASIDYVRLIISGLREHKISDEYINQVKQAVKKHSPSVLSLTVLYIF